MKWDMNVWACESGNVIHKYMMCMCVSIWIGMLFRSMCVRVSVYLYVFETCELCRRGCHSQPECVWVSIRVCICVYSRAKSYAWHPTVQTRDEALPHSWVRYNLLLKNGRYPCTPCSQCYRMNDNLEPSPAQRVNCALLTFIHGATHLKCSLTMQIISINIFPTIELVALVTCDTFRRT